MVGAGKTTVIKPIAERFNLVRFSSDEVRELLKENDLPYDFIKELLRKFTNEFLELGHGLALDADCGNPKTRKMMEDLAKEFNLPIFWIYINPPEEFILNKLKNIRSMEGFRESGIFTNGEQAVENYLNQKETRQEQNALKGFNFIQEVDTSRDDLGSQIEGVINKIEIALKNRDSQ